MIRGCGRLLGYLRPWNKWRRERRCGAASFANAATHALEDEMPSFYLAETVKYLYLLFDEDNFISKRPYVFLRKPTPSTPSRSSD